MGALATPLLLVASLGGAALQAAGSAMAGREQARAAAFERQQLQIQEEQNRTAAAQAEARRREELTANLETIQAIRASRGLSSASPTGMAILESVSEDETRDARIERLNFLLKADQARRGAELARRKEKTSLLAGNLGAAEALFSGVSRVASIFR